MVLDVVCILVVSVMYVYIWCVFVFFFKQKTAYEMRISDWSLDVCSSDLALCLHQLARRPGLRRALFGDIDVPPAGETVLEIPLRLAVTDEDEQIGRASCRERVCQYV